MGKIIGGNISGAVGSVVFYSYNGEKYVRAAIGRRARNSWSERQVLNRQRFKALSDFWMQFKFTQVGQIWRVAEEGKKGHNLFISANSPAFGPDGALVDMDRLHFSAGQLPQAHKLTANRVSGDPEKVEVSWQYDPKKGNAMPDDELMMMVSNDSKFLGPLKTGAIRKQESAVIQLPAVTGTIQGIYLFWGSEKRKLYSGDIYFYV